MVLFGFEMTPERLEKIKRVLERRQRDLTVVLDHVHKHRNHAAVLRTCDAVGIQRMHVVVDESEHLPFRGTAMGSQQWVDVCKYSDIKAAVAGVRESFGEEKNVQLLVANMSEDAVPYTEIDFCQPTALIMGAEKKGVSDASLSSADRQIYVPMLGMVESLNVSVAAALILNEAREQRSKNDYDKNARLTEAEYQHYLFRWGYPRLAGFCDLRGIPYPEVDEQGDIVDPDGSWREAAKAKEV